MRIPAEEALSKALSTLLVPLARLVIKRGLPYGELAELLKRAYVEAAQRYFAVPGQKQTISRIAVLTGLTRKEASRLVWEDEIPLEDVAPRSRGMSVMK